MLQSNFFKNRQGRDYREAPNNSQCMLFVVDSPCFLNFYYVNNKQQIPRQTKI